MSAIEFALSIAIKNDENSQWLFYDDDVIKNIIKIDIFFEQYKGEIEPYIYIFEDDFNDDEKQNVQA